MSLLFTNTCNVAKNFNERMKNLNVAIAHIKKYQEEEGNNSDIFNDAIAELNSAKDELVYDFAKTLVEQK